MLAFSLIELLVVVAIIALLTSLTLSCVVVIRGSAMGSACLSNQRQMYTGIFAYEIEEDGLLSPSAFHNWDRPYYQLMVAAHYLVTAGGQTNDIKNVLVCAAVKRTNSPPGNGSTITATASPTGSTC